MESPRFGNRDHSVGYSPWDQWADTHGEAVQTDVRNFVAETENKMLCEDRKRLWHTITIYIGGVGARSDTHMGLPQG